MGGGVHLSVHWRQVPDAANDGPAAHHPQQVVHHAELTAVPEGVPEAWIVLRDGHTGSNVGMRKKKNVQEGGDERSSKP